MHLPQRLLQLLIYQRLLSPDLQAGKTLDITSDPIEDKTSPDTGVVGVADVAGIALVSKKSR